MGADCDGNTKSGFIWTRRIGKDEGLILGLGVGVMGCSLGLRIRELRFVGLITYFK